MRKIYSARARPYKCEDARVRAAEAVGWPLAPLPIPAPQAQGIFVGPAGAKPPRGRRTQDLACIGLHEFSPPRDEGAEEQILYRLSGRRLGQFEAKTLEGGSVPPGLRLLGYADT